MDREIVHNEYIYRKCRCKKWVEFCLDLSNTKINYGISTFRYIKKAKCTMSYYKKLWNLVLDKNLNVEFYLP